MMENDIRLHGEDWPIIELGYGMIEIAEGHQSGTPAIIFGNNGSGNIGDPTDAELRHLPGKTLAVVIFHNASSLDVLLGKLHKIRNSMDTATAEYI